MTQIENEPCPFCAGHEDDTPPETLRLGRGPTGWEVRVVPNLYPAVERHEVVIHGAEHRLSFGELDDSTIDLVAEAWRRRANDTGDVVFAFVNEGFASGASREHTHSQLAWLPGPPPAWLAERGLPAGELVLERDGLSVTCPHASRTPYEVQIAPLRSEPEGLRSDLLAPALRLLADLVRRLQRIHGGPVPFNAWLHEALPWHVELVPRTARLAGLELGAGIWVNTMPPEVAAAQLRNAG